MQSKSCIHGDDEACISPQEIAVTMTLQWTAVALFLYAEIAVNLILCIPFISARRYCNLTHKPKTRCVYFATGA